MGVPVKNPLVQQGLVLLGFVADLASNINWDSASDFGLTAHGDADRALADMDDADRAELRRLLDEALGNRAI